MVQRTPTSFTAGRKVTLFATTYQPGDVVPNSEVKKVRNLSALLSKRILVPNVTTTQSAHNLLKHQSPTTLNPQQRRGL
jgi:hypothetical protein